MINLLKLSLACLGMMAVVLFSFWIGYLMFEAFKTIIRKQLKQ